MEAFDTLKSGKVYIGNNQSKKICVDIFLSPIEDNTRERLVHSGYITIESLRDTPREEFDPFRISGVPSNNLSLAIAVVENDILYMIKNKKELVKARVGQAMAYIETIAYNARNNVKCKIYLN